MGAVGASNAPPRRRPVIEWSGAQRTKTGEVESGDHYVVQSGPQRALVAVIDGLGHGAEAALAARQAVAALEGGIEESLVSLMRRCHDALRSTRGAVMSLAAFGAGDPHMEWLAIGNIGGVVLRAPTAARPRVEWLLVRGGVVGYRLPPLLVSHVPLTRGDTVVLATDGIRPEFADRLAIDRPSLGLAGRILAEDGTESDDALVLVVRYVGGAP